MFRTAAPHLNGIKRLLPAFLLGSVLFILAPSSILFGEELPPWGVAASPAVVNPAVRSPLTNVLSLDGEWDFVRNAPWNFRLGAGDPAWGDRSFSWDNAEKIQVPGNWESQGIGEPGPNVTWDCDWDKPIWEIRHIYMGRALYRKAITIPADWSGKAIWLKIGGVRTEAYIWIDKKRVAYVNNCCETEKFNITPFVKPGETTEIVALVRNDTPSRKGLLAAPHAFGGFYRSVELEATPTLYIDDVWGRGDIEGPTANIRTFIACAAPDAPQKGSLSITIRDTAGKKFASAQKEINGPGEYQTEIPLENGKLWTPEEPNLYIAEIVLKDETGNPIHGWNERFGIRKLEVRGKQFFLNGRSYFFRGMGDHHYDPMTLTEGPNRERFISHIKLYKEAGFNYARHHTHVPLPEYFDAADEVGLLLQPELPYYHDAPTEGFIFDPMRDLKELHYTCRRHPSFATYCCGNEGWLGSPLDENVYKWVKANDPDRLVLHEDGGRIRPGINSDFHTGDDKSPGFCVAAIKPWPAGQFDHLKAPFVAHEYLNLAIKMDPRLEDRFTGIRISPVRRDAFDALLKECGLNEDWGAATLRAGAKLQGYYQKQGLESARLDPECDGYAFWSITDASIPAGGAVNAVAAQGYLNVFWEPRPDGIPPKEFHHFNGPTVLLAQIDRNPPIFVSGETLPVTFSLSHFDAQTLPAGNLTWRLNANGKILAEGSLPVEAAAPGTAGPIASASIPVPDLDSPQAVSLEAVLDGTEIQNRWEAWLFPQPKRRSLEGFVVSDALAPIFEKRYDSVVRFGDAAANPEDVLIAAPDDPVAIEAQKQGRSLFLISAASPEPDVSLGWWALGSQVGTAFADSPVWGDFPLAPWMNGLWFRLIRKNAYDLRQPNPLGTLTPLAVGEGKETYYLYLGEKTEGDRRILVSYALDLLQETPEAAWLLDSLLKSFQK